MSTDKARREAAERLKAFHRREDEGQIRQRQTRGRVAFIARRPGWAIVVLNVLALITITLVDFMNFGFDLGTGVKMLMSVLFGDRAPIGAFGVDLSR